jgi:hypothetical protein
MGILMLWEYESGMEGAETPETMAFVPAGKMDSVIAGG